MKVKALVTETVIIQKEVELEVPDDTDALELEDLARDKACEETLQENNGWELASSEGIEVEVTRLPS